MVKLTDISEASSSSNDDDDHEEYDVFLSFRGADTRLNFTNHLHEALKDANLKTFLDDEEIETGVYLKPKLEIAIKRSRASVIVLSKNYATSTWCLDELVLILDQHKNFNQIVIPIFFHVEPNDVRKQKNSFGDAMEKHKQRMEAETDVGKRNQLAEKIKMWKEALTQVSHITGKNAKNRPETEFIKEIIDDIYRRLGGPIRSSLPLLIGMDYSIEFITSWLKDVSSHTVDIITILGISGIGKTSVANHVYELHRHEFDASGFIQDISRRCAAQSSGILDLQKQLLGNISKTVPIAVDRVSECTSNIENVLSRERVFLVLDDIDSVDQLDALLGNKDLHSGSKIIITAKNSSLTESCALFNLQVQPNHTTHLLKGLYKTASLRLLSYHAFKCEEVEVGYEEVSDNIVKYCGGHPLALKVMGSSLHKKDVSYWEGCINMLKQGPQEPIKNILKLSFNTLGSKNDMELFKHIACFFVGMDRDIAETILKACKINTICGITNLIEKCLLSIEWNNKLMMHSLIQVMGRDAVHQESPDKPEERSRLWHHTESYKVLRKMKGTGNIIGLALDMKMIEEKKLHGSLFELETDALSKMDSLKLLQLNYVQLDGCYKNFPQKLRWLCMQWFPLESLPSDLPMRKLVALDMSYSNIKSFDMSSSNPQPPEKRQKLAGSYSKDTQLLGSLKILDLSFCKQLHSLGGFVKLPALERLLVRNCIGLMEICESIEQCAELNFIDLSYCNKLENLLLGKLKKVKTLLLDGWNSGESQTEMRAINSQEMIKINKIGMNSQTSSSSIVMAIPRNLKFYVVSFPNSLVSLSLAYNNLSCESFPNDFSSLSMLKELILDGNPIVSMPSCVRTLPRLRALSMIKCMKLMSIYHPPPTLTELNLAESCALLHKVAFDPKMSPMVFNLDVNTLAISSIEIEGVVKVQAMADVEERVLRSLGWSNLYYTKTKCIKTRVFLPREEEELSEMVEVESQTQMYYEFGIFSTIYGGEEMPNWISERSVGHSISFTIPSSPKNLAGLNFGYMLFNDIERKTYLPTIKISNITKSRTWVYLHYLDPEVKVDGEYLIYISHWMFTLNDMEPGDNFTITTTPDTSEPYFVEERECMCGVSFVYEDGSMEEKEEEDALGYYKSWNHIISGDISPFQLTTGEYILQMCEIGRISNRIGFAPDYGSAIYKVDEVPFKALPNRKSSTCKHCGGII